MNNVRCSNCNGSGKERDSISLITGEVKYRTCPVCSGTGFVDAELMHYTTYPDQSLEKARYLMQWNGKPIELCIEGNHDFIIVFKNGNRFRLGGFTVGYRGTGPEYTKKLLDAAGFGISMDDIAEMKPPVTFWSIVVESPTIEEAKKKASEIESNDNSFISSEVIEDGTSKTINGRGMSKEAAVENAKDHIPKGSKIIKEDVCKEAEEGKTNIEANSEVEAGQIARKQIPWDATIQKKICLKPKSEGFLGLRPKPGLYEVSWVTDWLVSIEFQPLPAIRVNFRK
ncbi:MAG: hypothetical protein FJW61_01810 [Actinobacteria bacterium]|nr:hypothetical protein [Actinomycetota bacterium]MBM3709145.1 hypothetical protein [Actinomycetota bacterium]